MVINGPLKISVAAAENAEGWLLVIGFQERFCKLSAAEQGARFRDYLAELRLGIKAIKKESDRNRMGMLIVEQIAEQLLPHIEAEELDLSQSIVVQIEQKSEAVALANWLGQPPVQ